MREVKPPFSPESVTAEYADLSKQYGIHTVTGDRYSGQWVREQFEKNGITYEPCEQAKSDLYRELLPRLNSQRVELLDIPRLRTQLVGLERRTARGGRDSIDHGPGGHDDVANCVAGVLTLVGDEDRHAFSFISPRDYAKHITENQRPSRSIFKDSVERQLLHQIKRRY